MTPRRIAFLVFPRVTFLDFVGACEVVTDRRVVDEGTIVTAGGEARVKIAAQMEYRGHSPL